MMVDKTVGLKDYCLVSKSVYVKVVKRVECLVLKKGYGLVGKRVECLDKEKGYLKVVAMAKIKVVSMGL